MSSNDNRQHGHKIADQTIQARLHQIEVPSSQRRPRSQSTNIPLTATVTSADAHVSPLRRRQSLAGVSPSKHTAMYNATHPPMLTDGESSFPQQHSTEILDLHTSSMRRATRELLSANHMRSRQLVVDLQYHPASSSSSSDFYGNDDGNLGQHNQATDEVDPFAPKAAAYDEEFGVTVDSSPKLYHPSTKVNDGSTDASMAESEEGTALLGADARNPHGEVFQAPKLHYRKQYDAPSGWLSHLIQQSSAVAVVALLNIMVAIPFGVSYFPIGWKPADGSFDGDGDEIGDRDEVNGTFPLPEKQALGIRMFLFATFMGQLAFTFSSEFQNPIGLQMVENVPFLHALCNNVIRHQGYGPDALSTVFFLFGLSSVLVGLTFYLLGKWKLGRIVYFFPNHVLVGCIGGIGVFIVITAVEVTSDVTLTFDLDGIRNLMDHFHLLLVVLGFETVLRCLQYLTQDKHGNTKFPLLSPVFYCLITPLFYLGLWAFGVSIDQASEQGFFFSPVAINASNASSTSSWHDPYLWDMFQIIDFSKVSFTAVFQSTGTMIALVAFSLIHVPINIPAFAISTDVDTDMNAELIAHGYANVFSGMFGGLQTYMTYSNSLLYAKSGGRGKVSSLAIVALTIVLFVIGPSIANYLPRCMAGTLLLHIGIDLVLEGVYDSYGSYDQLEYAGIWAITLVMTIWGMTSALIAGVIAALTTYAMQSVNYQNPIRQVMTASTLRSSAWTRCTKSRQILEFDETGRSRILVFQLQGHLFFGNVAQLTDTIKDVLAERKQYNESPIVVIVDFTLVVGMDSSAAHAVAKLKKIMHRLFHVEVSIFVTGSDRGGFPCEFALSEALSPEAAHQVAAAGIDYNQLAKNDRHHAQQSEDTALLASPKVRKGSISISPGSSSVRATKQLTIKVDGRVCESLDDALRFAEDILIYRQDPSLECSSDFDELEYVSHVNITLDEEKYLAKKFLREILPESTCDLDKTSQTILSAMNREEFSHGQTLWESGAESTSMKLLVCGSLESIIEDTGASEFVKKGNMVGELGLVHGTRRLTTLVCCSEKAILYSLSTEDFAQLRKKKPEVAASIDGVAIRYLAHRVQHVSNRYFHTTLPV